MRNPKGMTESGVWRAPKIWSSLGTAQKLNADEVDDADLRGKYFIYFFVVRRAVTTTAKILAG